VGEWTDVAKIKYTVFTGVRNPNHPAHSESLHRVRYPGRRIYWRRTLNFSSRNILFYFNVVSECDCVCVCVCVCVCCMMTRSVGKTA